MLPESTRRNELENLFSSCPVIPVITIDNPQDAVPLANALISGGIRCMEITLRTQAAFESAKNIIQNVPEAIVGIGTILTGDDLKKAHAIGADHQQVRLPTGFPRRAVRWRTFGDHLLDREIGKDVPIRIELSRHRARTDGEDGPILP